MNYGTFLTKLNNIFLIKVSTSFYRYHDNIDYPYGTMHVNIQCGAIDIGFSIKPEKIQKFLSGLITGETMTLYGDASIYEFKDFIEVQKRRKAIYEEEKWITDMMGESKPINDAISRFYVPSSQSTEDRLEVLIKELTEQKKLRNAKIADNDISVGDRVRIIEGYTDWVKKWRNPEEDDNLDDTQEL
jgi:hypothetical protein